MGSQYPPKSYDETTLLALEEALRDVWDVVKARDLFRDWDKDSELKQAVAAKLMDLVDIGISDPQELRSRTLEIFDLARPN